MRHINVKIDVNGTGRRNKKKLNRSSYYNLKCINNHGMMARFLIKYMTLLRGYLRNKVNIVKLHEKKERKKATLIISCVTKSN